MALIDKETIRAEIERWIRSIESCPFIEAEVGAYDKRNGKLMAYRDLLSFLDTLSEQPMEGLEEEIGRYWNRVTGFQPKFAVLELTKEDLAKVARHFYELGCFRTAEKYDEIEYNRQRAEEAELSEDLDEEVKRYWNDHALEYRIGRVADIDFLQLTARHFAEWGRNNLK